MKERKEASTPRFQGKSKPDPRKLRKGKGAATKTGGAKKKKKSATTKKAATTAKRAPVKKKPAKKKVSRFTKGPKKS